MLIKRTIYVIKCTVYVLNVRVYSTFMASYQQVREWKMYVHSLFLYSKENEGMKSIYTDKTYNTPNKTSPRTSDVDVITPHCVVGQLSIETMGAMFEQPSYQASCNYAIGTEQLTKIKNNPDAASSYPAIDPVDVDMSQYNTIIIATPLWWSQMASNMQTFLFKYGQEMEGKNIGLIVSSHSSGISGVEADAKRLVPNGKFMSKSLWINNANHSKRKSMLEQWLLDVDYTSLTATTNNTMYLKINNNILSVDLESNSSAEALVELLKKNDITYEAHDYGDFEKVGELGHTLPENNKQITTEPGDVILYNGNNICIFYGSNSWSYTRLGKIRDINAEDLKSILGNGDVAVTFTLGNPTFASLTRANSSETKVIYSINGKKLSQVPEKGFYIENGIKKTK